MGLCRTFTLRAEHKDGNPILDPAVSDAIKRRLDTVYPGWYGTVDDFGEMTIYDVSWIDYAKDMTRIAQTFPDIVFVLHCDNGMDDTWDAGFCGTRFDQQAAIIPELNYAYLRGDTAK